VQRIDGRLILSPTDLTRHQECHHLTALDLAVTNGAIQPPVDGPGYELQSSSSAGLRTRSPTSRRSRLRG